MTVTDATDFAREGNVADGYTVLLAGLHRARQARDDGGPWGEELVERYTAALERFAGIYGVGRA